MLWTSVAIKRLVRSVSIAGLKFVNKTALNLIWLGWLKQYAKMFLISECVNPDIAGLETPESQAEWIDSQSIMRPTFRVSALDSIFGAAFDLSSEISFEKFSQFLLLLLSKKMTCE